LTEIRPNSTILHQVTLPSTFRIENVTPYLISQTLDPHEDFRVSSALRDRRRLRAAEDFDLAPIWSSEELKMWAAKSTPSILRVSPSNLSRDDARYFGIDLIKQAKSLNVPVIWAFGSMKGTEAPKVSGIEILTSLIQQVFEQHPELFSGASDLSEQIFQQAGSVRDWMGVFAAVLKKIPRVLTVLLANEQTAAGMREIDQHWQILQDQNVSTVVKVFITTYDHVCDPELSLAEGEGTMVFNLAIGHGRRVGGSGRNSRTSLSPGIRGVGRRGDEQFVSTFQDFVNLSS